MYFIDLEEEEEENECPPDQPLNRCLVNPCDVASCDADDNARCVPNYCGGCTAEFYDRRGNQVDCSCPKGEALCKKLRNRNESLKIQIPGYKY